jgi:hypothetical protein
LPRYRTVSHPSPTLWPSAPKGPSWNRHCLPPSPSTDGITHTTPSFVGRLASKRSQIRTTATPPRPDAGNVSDSLVAR